MSPREIESIRAYAAPFLRVIESMPNRSTRHHLLGLAIALGATAGIMGSPGSAIKEAMRIATAHCKVVAAEAARLQRELAGRASAET